MRARRAPRSAATQHITFDEVKCFGSPRTSQIPRSGRRQCVERGLDLADEDRPDALVEPIARLRVQVERVEDGAPHVVLALVVGAVADTDRSCLVVSLEVVEDALVELALAADPVHHLEIARPVGDVRDEVHEVVRLPVEAERVQAPQRERRVADPAVAVVPVAFAVGGFGERGRRRGGDRSSRRIGEALEGQRRTLEAQHATGGPGSGRGRASAANGARSRPAAGTPRRTWSAARPCPRTGRRSGSRLP